jgi:hypothetical protein
MANHFVQIGFAIESAEQFGAFINQLAPRCEVRSVDGGAYLVWSSDGVEIYLQGNDQRELIGAHPHFAGPARMSVRIDAAVERPEHTPLDGAWHAWANPTAGDDRSGDFPFVFDAANFRQSADVALPRNTHVQLAAFAHEIETFATEEEYTAGTAVDGKPGFASESFVPAGLFVKDTPPSAHAIFSGHVLAARLMRNGLTGRSFHHLHVRTLGGEVDVVAAENMIAKPIAPGHIVTGKFWLSGVIVDPVAATTPKRGFFSRLFKQ